MVLAWMLVFGAAAAQEPAAAPAQTPTDASVAAPPEAPAETPADKPPSTILWQIGEADNDTEDLALAPNGYKRYSQDGYFVAGYSDPKTDWPYVHPGPLDGWAGTTPKVFTIIFSVAKLPLEGECQLQFDFVDVHKMQPPKLEVYVNGNMLSRQLVSGSGSDAALMGDPSKGQEQKATMAFPTRFLRRGDNVISIKNAMGSWLVYDSVWLEAPQETQTAPLEKPITQINKVQSLPLLYEKEGALYQTIRLWIRHFGEPLEAQLRLNNREPEPVSIQPGAQTLDVEIPALESAMPGAVDIMKDGEVQSRRECLLFPARQWTVYLMPHTHLDIGYTHLQSEVEQKQWQHLETAMGIIQQTADYPAEARFKWLPEGLWAVDSYLKQASPEKRQAFIDAVKAGSIGLDALYGNELTALCRPEELIELTGYARRLSKEYGLTIDTAMISDVPGYTWGIVPVLAQSGVKYFSIGPNAGHRIGYTLSEWGEKPFYWMSPSGDAKVLCWVAGKAYSWFHSGPIGDGQKIVDYLAELQAGDYPYDMVQVRYSTGGDNGPPDPQLPDFVKQWNEKYVSPKLVLATTREAFAEFEQRYGDSLPKESGDFTPYWEDGAGSSARETGINRAAAERLVQANALWAMLNPGPYPAADFQAAWRNVLLYDEHTWGAHNSISEPESDFAKGQWAIKQAFALDAERQSCGLLERAMSTVKADGAAVKSFMVYNTSSWARSGLVLLPKAWGRPGDQVLGPDGTAVASQALSTGELAFVAKNVPAFGALRYSLGAGQARLKGDAKATEQGLSNGIVVIEIDPESGAVSSLKMNGRDADLVDRRNGPGLNDYLYVAGRVPKEPQRNGKAAITVKEPGPLVASLLIQSDAPGCKGLTREVRLVSGLDYAEITDTLDKNNVYEKEAVHLAFPFNVPESVVRMDIPFAVVSPESGQLAGACKNYFTVQRWVDVSNAEYGVTWATVDAPLVELGRIAADPLAVGWIKTLEPTATLYSYVMNNYWETNYKASQEGPAVFRYALRPHDAYDAAEAQGFGMTCSQPLVAAPVPEGVKPPAPLLKSLPKGIMATMLKPGDDGEAVILRLFNATDQPQKAKLEWSNPKPKQVELSTLSEEAGTPFESADLLPWQWITLRIVR